jgi:hypothetical protein
MVEDNFGRVSEGVDVAAKTLSGIVKGRLGSWTAGDSAQEEYLFSQALSE